VYKPSHGNCYKEFNLIYFYLKISNIRIRQKRIFLIGIEQAEILHDNSDKKIEDNVRDDDVEGTEEDNCSHKISAIGLPEI